MVIEYYNRSCIILSVIFFVNCSVCAQIGKYPIQNFNPTDYKAGIQNIDFAQNRNQSIFVANNLGVLSYNGEVWKTHQLETGKKQRSLAFDSDKNRLYVGSQGDFGFFSEDWEYRSLSGQASDGLLDFDEVWDVFILNTDVYFCTFSGIFQFSDEKLKLISNEEPLDKSFCVGDKLFTQNKSGILYEIQDGELIAVSQVSRDFGLIRGMVSIDDGYLLFDIYGQVRKLDFTGRLSDPGKDFERLNGEYINHVLQLSDSRICISTQTAGVFLYDLELGTFDQISINEGIASNACLRAYQDFYGNLWIGMQNGIALIDINSPLKIINKDINIEGSGYAVYEAESGVYFTTSNGIYYKDNASSEAIFLKGTEGPSYGISEIRGRIYAGHHEGLYLLDNGSAERIANTNGMWLVKQLKSYPQYAIGGTYQGLYLFEIRLDAPLKPVAYINGFNESSRFVEEDDDGNIWVAQYYKGLFKLIISEDLLEVRAVNASKEYDALVNQQILITDLDDDLYVASNAELYVLNEKENTLISSDKFNEILSDESIFLLEQDYQNNIHFYTENKVGFFKQISNDNYAFVPSSLNKLRYHLNNDLLHVSFSNSGIIYFSGNEGFIAYDPELESTISSLAPVVITSIEDERKNKIYYKKLPFESIDEKPIEIETDAGSRSLKVTVESYQFNNINDQNYHYYLNGFDEGEVERTTSSYKEYTNLRDGQYNLVVTSENALGDTLRSNEASIKIKPPLYRTLGAKISYFTVVILSLFFLARIQGRYHKKKTEKIENIKQIELDRKQERLNSLKAQKEKEVIQLQEEKLENELYHLNTQLAASTMNLVVKNNFINTIREEINEVAHQGVKKETKKGLNKIVQDIDTALRLQQDWEQFEHYFDKVHGDFLARIRQEYKDLTPNEQRLCAFLRLNLSTKEIANLLNVSTRGVEIARYRLRKKLNLNKGENLSKYILEY